MSIVFQPKIIIGSVIGVIASAIGIIAVFFPSLFNLETKKIAEYTNNLNTEKDAIKFIDFLKQHQDGIVYLNITYTEQKRYRNARDAKGNFIIDYDDEYTKNIIGEDGIEDGVKKEDLNNLCMKEIIDGLEGKESYGSVDKDGYIFIKSEFKCKAFLNNFNFFRNKGSFGIWIAGKKEDGSDDRNYHIIINADSKNNSLFKWSIKDREKNTEEMQLSGNFFVNKFIDAHDYGEQSSEQRVDSMSPQWGSTYNGAYEIGDQNMEVIELQPLSKKEIESKNY